MPDEARFLHAPPRRCTPPACATLLRVACALSLLTPAGLAAAQDAAGEQPSDAPELSSEVEAEAAPRLRASLEEGFILESADAQQSMRLFVLLSGRADVNLPDGTDGRGGATIRLARLTAMGALLGPELTYLVQAEFVRAPALLDLELNWALGGGLNLRAGRMRVPTGRQWIMGLNTLALLDRSVVSDTFRPGRDTGLTLEGRWLDERLEARLGVYGEDRDTRPKLAARLAIAPLGSLPYSEDLALAPGPALLAFAVHAWWDQRTPTERAVDLGTGQLVQRALPTDERATGGLDVTARVGGFAATAEAYVQRIEVEGEDAELAAGAFVQASQVLVPELLQLALRYDYVAPRIRAFGADGFQRHEAALTYFALGPALRLQARYAYDRTVGMQADSLPVQGHLVDAQFVLAL